MKNSNGLFGLPFPFARACSSAKTAGLSLIAIAALASQANAVVLSLDGSNNPSPSGTSGAWVVATFADTAANTVRLTIDPSGLYSATNPGEALTEFTFNIRPNFANSLSFTFIDPVPPTQGFSVEYAMNSKTISGGGNIATMGAFDILVNMPPPGDFVTSDDLVVIDIVGSGLSASDFDFATSEDFYAAAKIQRLVNGGSTQIFALTSDPTNPVINPVPEPGSMAALMGLLAGGAFLRSRRTPKA